MGQFKVSQLWIYPIKSFGGIPVEQARVFPKGLQWDRRWMLVDEQNVFMTQRVLHRMALLRPSLTDDQLRVSLGNESIDIPSTTDGPTLSAVIWDDIVDVVEVSKSASEWFSEQLEKTCKLVAFPEDNTRSVDVRYNPGGSQVSLADGYPLLVIGQGTLDDLNNKLSTPVPMNRFRPNIVFTGGTPFVEDTWTRFKVGDNGFAGVKPCARCVVPTVDQDTGVMGKEPLATLNSYRKRDGKVYFGMNLIPIDHKTIRVGDEITF